MPTDRLSKRVRGSWFLSSPAIPLDDYQGRACKALGAETWVGVLPPKRVLRRIVGTLAGTVLSCPGTQGKDGQPIRFRRLFGCRPDSSRPSMFSEALSGRPAASWSLELRFYLMPRPKLTPRAVRVPGFSAVSRLETRPPKHCSRRHEVSMFEDRSCSWRLLPSRSVMRAEQGHVLPCASSRRPGSSEVEFVLPQGASTSHPASREARSSSSRGVAPAIRALLSRRDALDLAAFGPLTTPCQTPAKLLQRAMAHPYKPPPSHTRDDSASPRLSWPLRSLR